MHFISLALESTFLSAENGSSYRSHVSQLKSSCFKDDLNVENLARHLVLLQDMIKKSNSSVKKVTLVLTICEATNISKVLKDTLSFVHGL